ncbi:MAG: protein-L-isoaspartate O-methyltransferase [Pseudomonadota bacterium]
MPTLKEQRVMMVDTQVRPSDVTKFPIIDAMLSVERERFVPAAARSTAYSDCGLAMGQGRQMLEPRVLAKALDLLDVQPNEFVLTVGAGLGYTVALLARLAEAVVALEEDEDFASDAESQLGETGADNVAVVTGSLVAGAEAMGPFDVILIDGGVEVLPDELAAQLKDGGRIVAIFVEGALGVCRLGLKSAGHITWRDAFNASAEILPGFEREEAFQL